MAAGERASATPWPELPPPSGVIDCNTFGMGGHGRFVWGEGNPASRLMFVLDNPGAREDKAGVAFVCGTRRTLRAAMEEAGIPPDDVYVTYLIKCRSLRAYDKPRARAIGADVLRQQVGAVGPHRLVLFGDVVVQSLIGADVSVKTSRGTDLKVFQIDATTTYHPLAARRRPNLYPLLVEDLGRIRHVSRGP